MYARRQLTCYRRLPGNRLVRLTFTLLLLVSLGIHGTGASLVMSALARIVAEESAEHCSGEVELREISHKCGRSRLTHPMDGVVTRVVIRRCGNTSSLPLRESAIHQAHLLGAGIALRC